ncbi:protein kinase [Leptolyngbya sp. FACHB-321]|uniref:serine/threonine protein kinase n=1 Tax=Leptolyngbya sp. FACHB-321 TaxID=2692807 RepID=UPI0016898C63|nr:serine/threonine-protein kinase [Leptolyngbya sp. FACHB-321]MBD2035064.1 protein kinase [Leptolyngbya sp. FACHB-321]
MVTIVEVVMPMNLTAGTPLQDGKYVLNNLLGQSAWGITFKATQTRLNQAVVLKTLRSQPEMDIAPLRQPFLEEVRRFTQCQHPGLVRVLDSFTEAGLPFAVMDYVAGQTLAELVRSQKPLPEAQAVQYIRQASSALSVIHRHGLLHRDVKPENLVRPTGAAFVVLVGFSITPGAVPVEINRADSQLANPYAAIELQQAKALTAAADIYALAATLYFLVTQHEPIAASHRQQTPLVTPRQLQPQLSTAIEHAILSGMAVNVQERPQTIADWLALLPDSNRLPAAQGVNGAGKLPAAINLPHTANGSGRTTAPPAPPALANPTHATAPVPPVPMSTPSFVPAPKSRLPKALGVTAAIAIAGGFGLGLVLRFSAINGIGPTLFQTTQDFPPVQNWPLQATPEDLLTAPVLPESVPFRDQEPGDRPPVIRVAPDPAPVPVIPTPSPTATIEATPAPVPTPVEPDIQPSPPPSPAPATDSTPRPLPAGEDAPDPSGIPLERERLPLRQPNLDINQKPN